MKITGIVILLCVLSGCAGNKHTLTPISGQLEPVNKSMGASDGK